MPSKDQRNSDVRCFLLWLLVKALHCDVRLSFRPVFAYFYQVFDFGSVALKTYLPDGDVDVGVFFHERFDAPWIPTFMKLLEQQQGSVESLPVSVDKMDWIHAEVLISAFFFFFFYGVGGVVVCCCCCFFSLFGRMFLLYCVHCFFVCR